MGFCSKILGGGGDLQSVIFLKKKNAASVVVTCQVVGTLQDGKKLNFVY